MKAIVEFPKGKEKEFQRMMKELGAYVGACSEEMFISRACSIEDVRQQIDDFCEDCRKDGRSAPVLPIRSTGNVSMPRKRIPEVLPMIRHRTSSSIIRSAPRCCAPSRGSIRDST